MMKYLLLLLFLFELKAETFIVEMKQPLTIEQKQLVLKSGGAIELFDNAPTSYFLKTYKVDGLSSEKVKKLLPVKTLEKVHKAQFFGIIPAKNSEKLKPDQLFTMQWNLYNQGQTLTKLYESTRVQKIYGIKGKDINWKEGIGLLERNLQKTPVVAVVDMGIDLDHPELKNQIAKNLVECDAAGNIVDTGEDKDGNGLKGDCMGWNFAAQDMANARRPYDDNGHGTHVSGIIAAESNSLGIAGISQKIKILPIRVTGSIDETQARQEIQPLTDRIAKGILYATRMKVDAINLSLGWTRAMDTKYLREAIDYAISNGIVIIAAAGNNNNNAAILPCANYDVICVGAITANGEISDFSNYGGEVDVLAPGDEIISTIPWQKIPLQLNLQGYDIISGTSQAAPHVSALAALLKANFPGSSINEIERRIIDSAQQSPDLLKANHGLIDMKKAFLLDQAPSVKPIFKNASLITFDYSTLAIKYSLPVKNFGDVAENIKIHVKSNTPGVSIDQNFNKESINIGEVTHLNIEGKVESLLTSNLISLEVEVQIGENVAKVYHHQFRLGYDLLKSLNFQSKKFKFQNNTLPVGNIKDGKAINYIQSVEVIFREDSSNQEFYLSRRDKEKKQFEIKLFRTENNEIAEAQGTIIIPEAVDLLNVYRFDVNQDGEDDYILRTLNCSESCEDRQKAKRYLQYSYWSKKLEPLWGSKSFWKFLPKLVNVNLFSQRFHYIKHPELGVIAVPYFVESTIIPKEQQKLKPFEVYDYTQASHLLRLYPILTNGGYELETQVVTNKDFLERLASKVGVNKKENLQALKNLVLNKDDFKNGILTTLFTTGEGIWGQNVLVKLKLGEIIDVKILSGLPTLWGFEQHNSLSLNSSTEKNNFVGLHSSTVLQTFQIGESQHLSSSYSSYGTSEPPLSHVGSFHDDNTAYTFIQTPSKIMMLKSDNKETRRYEQKINRFSFLPGYIFADTFYPVKSQIEGKNVPALYVDETDIQNYLVSLTIFNNEKILSPLAFSLFIPPICKSLNPILNEQGFYTLSILCWNKSQWEMLYLPLSM